jgi:hypothetical protein
VHLAWTKPVAVGGIAFVIATGSALARAPATPIIRH